jgi:hypothetical protein
MKKIIIVAPEQYSDLGKRISHEISKNENSSSAFFTPKQFEDNQMKITGKQLAIYIGDPEENKLTKEYLPIIKTQLPDNKAGVFYGYDGSKAIVYGNGDLGQIGEFKKLYKKVKNNKIEIEGKNSNTNDSLSFLTSIFLLGVIGIAGMSIFKFVKKKKKEKKLKKHQTELALYLFFLHEIDKWTNN